MTALASRSADSVAAIVLAAGRSSRMGDFKPLMPFGERTLVGHVVAGLRAAGVAEVHVVTGFQAQALQPELERIGVTAVHNAEFDRGMFSSVQAGIASLPAETDAFLLMPVDMPLVRPGTIGRLVEATASDQAAVFYPTFRGARGHPPLIRRPLFAEILCWDGDGGLAELLSRHEREAHDVKVFDWGCLTDMDRREDFYRVASALARRRFPDPAECETMLEEAATPAPVRRHCRAVAALAEDIARRLRAAGEPIDPALTRAAAWLHDIAKGLPHHAEAGAAMVGAFGFPELADAVARHTDLGGDNRLDEAAVVYLADKLVQGEARVSLEARFVPALTRFAGDPMAFAAASCRYAEAKAIEDAIEARIGRIVPPCVTARETLLGAA
jgi:putative nucleotidyltransferase with HDIG domain